MQNLKIFVKRRWIHWPLPSSVLKTKQKNSSKYGTGMTHVCIPVPEIIDPVFAKTSQNARFLLSKNERFGLVFVKTGSINSGTVVEGWKYSIELWTFAVKSSCSNRVKHYHNLSIFLHTISDRGHGVTLSMQRIADCEVLYRTYWINTEKNENGSFFCVYEKRWPIQFLPYPHAELLKETFQNHNFSYKH